MSFLKTVRDIKSLKIQGANNVAYSALIAENAISSKIGTLKNLGLFPYDRRPFYPGAGVYNGFPTNIYVSRLEIDLCTDHPGVLLDVNSVPIITIRSANNSRRFKYGSIFHQYIEMTKALYSF